MGRRLSYKSKLNLLLIGYSCIITALVMFLGFEFTGKIGTNLSSYPSTFFIASDVKELELGITKGMALRAEEIPNKLVTNVQLESIYQKNWSNNFLKAMILVFISVMILSAIISRIISKRFLQPMEKVTASLGDIENIDNINFEDDVFSQELSGVKNAMKESSNKIKRLLAEANSLNSYITHEQKNTLAILRAKIQLGEREELINLVDKMSSSLDDILALNATEDIKNLEVVDLSIVCAEAVETYSKIYPNIELLIDDVNMPTIMGRELWIYRGLCNLIENGIKYGNESKITVSVYEQYGSGIITVEDKGSGISSKDLDNIFNYKYRCENLNKDGYGIGLSLVSHITELCGGIVYAESQLNKGSKFYMVFKALTID